MMKHLWNRQNKHDDDEVQKTRNRPNWLPIILELKDCYLVADNKDGAAKAGE